jgi:hypothetical protein
MTFRPRASNLFLGFAKDINGAITLGLRLDGKSEINLPEPAEKSQLWLIVFMGFNSSTPPQWNIARVEYNESKIRVTYSTDTHSLQRTRDFEPYFYWIPLQNFQAGRYDLELRDASTREAVLTRQVQLQKANR